MTEFQSKCGISYAQLSCKIGLKIENCRHLAHLSLSCRIYPIFRPKRQVSFRRKPNFSNVFEVHQSQLVQTVCQ